MPQCPALRIETHVLPSNATASAECGLHFPYHHGFQTQDNHLQVKTRLRSFKTVYCTAPSPPNGRLLDSKPPLPSYLSTSSSLHTQQPRTAQHNLLCHQSLQYRSSNNMSIPADLHLLTPHRICRPLRPSRHLPRQSCKLQSNTRRNPYRVLDRWHPTAVQEQLVRFLRA